MYVLITRTKMTKNKIEKNIEQRTALPTAVKKQDKIKSKNVMPVYLFYPCKTKRQINKNVEKFFTKDIDSIIANCISQPVFFSIENAIQYGRFMSNNYFVLKAYVPETAIVGKSQALYLKNNSLTKLQVHGCYPDWGRGKIYYRNPNFYKLLESAVSL